MNISINGKYSVNPLSGVVRYASELEPYFKKKTKIFKPRFKNKIYQNFWEQFILPVESKNSLLFSPCNIGPILFDNQIMTIHDTSPIDHPEWFKTKFSKWYQVAWRLLARNCRKIITVSNFSKKQLVNKLNVDEEKIISIYNGISNFSEPCYEKIKLSRSEWNLEKPFILFVGTLEPRKHLKGLLEAWKGLSEIYQNKIQLLIVGESRHVFKALEINDSENVIKLGNVSDHILKKLYTQCVVFISPTFYEGFDFPPLEAMRCGSIVCASNIDVHKEILEDLPIYFDPSNTSEMISSMKQAIDMKNEVKLGKKMEGMALAQSYSWNTCAEKTFRVLERGMCEMKKPSFDDVVNQEYFFWKNSKNESPKEFTVENIINKMSEAKTFVDCLKFVGFRLEPRAKVLELGAGQGWGSCIIKKLFPQSYVIATDISDDALISSKYWEKIFDVKIDCTYSTYAHKIREEDESIDTIFCFAAAHHLYFFEEAIKEISRILKKNGKAYFFYEPSVSRLFYKIAYWRVNKKRPNVHEDVLVPSEISGFGKKYGLNCSVKFYPTIYNRGQLETLYYLALKQITHMQAVLPCTANYVFEK